MNFSSEPVPSVQRIIFSCWGKANKNCEHLEDAYHLLPYHNLGVVVVGFILLAEEKPLVKKLAEFLAVGPKQLQRILVLTLALHDLGKFASSFQKHYEHNNLTLLTSENYHKYYGKAFCHDRLGLYFWQQLEMRFLLAITSKFYCTVLAMLLGSVFFD